MSDTTEMKLRIIAAYGKECWDYYSNKVDKQLAITGRVIEDKVPYIYKVITNDEEQNRNYFGSNFTNKSTSHASKYVFTKKYGVIHVDTHRKRYKLPKYNDYE